MQTPNLVVYDRKAGIGDIPDFAMAGKSGNTITEIDPDELIELPEGSQLYFMPGRQAVGFDRKNGKRVVLDDFTAVAAYIPPAYTHFKMAAYRSPASSERLPLFSYTAVGFYKNKYYVPAIHIDDDEKHQPTLFDNNAVSKKVDEWKKKFPNNRLISHHGEVCAIQYGCPNAKNLFLGRFEAPVAVASACNANCIGCISFQPEPSVPSPQNRLTFTPTVQEIAEYGVLHLENAQDAILSFGQGCEGEPLLRGDLIRNAILEIRRRTSRGIIHINTNGSRPDVLEKLFQAGLDSIRVSMNSAQPTLYDRYYKPNNYELNDLFESLKLARKLNKFSSINYFVFPGITDSESEFSALDQLIRTTELNLIQWRNFNIDPDWYLSDVCYDYDSKALGMRYILLKLKNEFPKLMSGYLNKPERIIKSILT